jgi:hypothetical protein
MTNELVIRTCQGQNLLLVLSFPQINTKSVNIALDFKKFPLNSAVFIWQPSIAAVSSKLILFQIVTLHHKGIEIIIRPIWWGRERQQTFDCPCVSGPEICVLKVRMLIKQIAFLAVHSTMIKLSSVIFRIAFHLFFAHKINWVQSCETVLWMTNFFINMIC